MAGNGKSFWSTTSGVVAGIAGTLTGVVGLVTLAAQMGWIGSAENEGQSASGGADMSGSATTVDDNGASTSGRASRSGAHTAPKFTVDPSAVSFDALGGRAATVAVRNNGSVDLNVESITVEGEDAGQFAVSSAPCTSGNLDPGRSCSIEVSFTPEGTGTSKATLVVEVSDAPAREVPLSANSLL